jgi:endonuclease III
MSCHLENARSGAIWKETPSTRSQAVRRVCELLEAAYGRPRLGNPRDPMDDLMYVILSNKTSPIIAGRVYGELKRLFHRWDDLLAGNSRGLRRVLAPAGLFRVRSRQIRAALLKVRKDFGRCDLNRLRAWACEHAQAYLTSLPGVSEKVAKCVMMYSLKARVLPVDAHVHRIAVRLGWTARKRADQCHAELEALVPPSRRYAFHVDCIVHGRVICRPVNPSCGDCRIRRYCRYDGANGDE